MKVFPTYLPWIATQKTTALYTASFKNQEKLPKKSQKCNFCLKRPTYQKQHLYFFLIFHYKVDILQTWFLYLEIGKQQF